jgi:hypothetical protein
VKIALQTCTMELNNPNWTNGLNKSKVALGVNLVGLDKSKVTFNVRPVA